MQPLYLSSDQLYLRAMIAGDAALAAAWFPGAFPVNGDQASRWLREQHDTSPWDGPPHTWLAVVERPTDTTDAERNGAEAVVGGVRMSHPRGRTTDVKIRIAPSIEPVAADQLQADVMRLVVPWARDELEAMVVTVAIGSDQPVSIAVAQELGMLQAARLRDHLARPGRRADLLWYQALNADRRVPEVVLTTGALTLVPAGPEIGGAHEGASDA